MHFNKQHAILVSDVHHVFHPDSQSGTSHKVLLSNRCSRTQRHVFHEHGKNHISHHSSVGCPQVTSSPPIEIVDVFSAKVWGSKKISSCYLRYFHLPHWNQGFMKSLPSSNQARCFWDHLLEPLTDLLSAKTGRTPNRRRALQFCNILRLVFCTHCTLIWNLTSIALEVQLKTEDKAWHQGGKWL